MDASPALAPTTSVAASTDTRAEVIRLRRLVADLVRPDPVRYWLDGTLAAGAAWLAFVALCTAPAFAPWCAIAYLSAVLLWYRASIFIHELAHLRPTHVPGFRTAWNLAVGLPMLLPSILYEGVHAGHHRKATYGTEQDPEYLPLAGSPALIVTFVLAGLALPLLLAFRFLVAVPASVLSRRLRRWLEINGSAFTMNPKYARKPTAAERRSLWRWDALLTTCVWLFVLGCARGWLPWKIAASWYAVYAGVCVLNHLRTLVAHRYRSGGRPTDHAGQLADSIDTPEPWWTALWAPLGLRYHALHHLLPNLPYHRLPVAYERIRSASSLGDLYSQARGPGFWRSLRLLWSDRPTGSRSAAESKVTGL
jgi:fatty acid desaturase